MRTRTFLTGSSLHLSALIALSAICAPVALVACSDDTGASAPPDDAGVVADRTMTNDGAIRDDGSPADGAIAADAGADASSAHDAGADASPDAAAPSIDVQILAFNDFHGNLRPPTPSNAIVIAKAGDPSINDAGSPMPTDAGVQDGGPLNVQLRAGGAAYFAAHVNRLRAANPNTLLVSAGDMTGASPLVSATYDDEPTVRVMNAIGVDYNAVGNHEFDHGPSELLRLQYGGCNVSDRTDAGGSCFADPSFPGAAYSYLAANVDVSSAKTLFPAYEIKEVGGARIAFIGMTLRGTPQIVSSAGTAGLTFVDEVATVNALVPELKKQAVDAIIVLIHQGGFQSGTYNECAGFSGGTVAAGQLDIGAIADGLDPAVDAIASAHTHVAYNCLRNGRILTSAASYGRIITQMNFTIDPTLHKVTSKSATNVVVSRDITPDSTVQALVDKYASAVAPIAERHVGQISNDILRSAGANGEAPLGDVAADAILAATLSGGAQVAFTNIGGLRDSLLYSQYYSEGDGVVTFEKAQAVMPFRNKVEILKCTGAQIISAIQQNVFVQGGGATKVLQISNGLSYAWSAGSADANGQNAADPTSFTLGGAPIDPSATYVVGTTDFLAGGGDGYVAFKQCALQSTVGIDLDALTAYLSSHEPLAAPAATRITKK